jgi:hypothetical protein
LWCVALKKEEEIKIKNIRPRYNKIIIMFIIGKKERKKGKANQRRN